MVSVKGKVFIIAVFFFSLLLFSQEAVIINKTGFDLYNIYVSPSGMEEWSDDLQPYDVIVKDGYRILDLHSYEGEFLFDFRFIDVDGDEYIKKNVDLNLHRKVVVTLDELSYILDAEQVSREDEWVVSVRNNTGGTVMELYISPHASNSWGGNLIENDYMENKSTRQFFMSGREEFIDYDIRMDSRDGKYVREEVTLSNNATVVITSADRE
ncbi:MAG: hypothetical protein JXR86_12270 [Spirochaetales bacterium]|nr:hypothetical protein [Spirochaetales bacterium]